jgi:translation elongation factor TU
MKHLVAGTAGHIDHGKTALVKALTGIDTDRLPEEKRRGISIELGYAYLDLPDGTRVGLVDVPGHERFIRTMVAGATGIDFVILVVAADDSVMPQTREHLAILQLLGVRDGLVALNKTDLVDPELAEVVAEEVRDITAGTFLAGARVVPVSSLTGQGLDELRAAIAEVAARVPERTAAGVARVPIDRSFALAGHGTVVTGTVFNGSLRVGGEVEILPKGFRARIRSLQSHGVGVEAVFAGQRAAINLAGVKHEDLRRGDAVCSVGAFLPTSMIDGRIVLSRDLSHAVEHGASVSFHLATSEVHGRLALLDRMKLDPGGETWGQVRLAEPVVARRGDRFILRTAGGDLTIGGGQVLDAHPLKHRRHRLDAAEALERLASGDLDAAVAHELLKAGTPLRISVLAPHLAETRAAIEALCRSAAESNEGRGTRGGGNDECRMTNVGGGMTNDRMTNDESMTNAECPNASSDGLHPHSSFDIDSSFVIRHSSLFLVPAKGDVWVYDLETLGRFRERVAAALAEHHKAKPLLATGLAGAAFTAKVDPERALSEEVISAMMGKLAAEGTVRVVADTYALASHRVALSDRQMTIRAAILEACRQQPFAPPTGAELEQKLPFPPRETAAVHEAMLKAGELVDGGICGFHPDAIAEAWRRLEGYLRQHGQITMSEFRELLGTTRRFAMGLMHHFDTAGRVVRDGDFRRLRDVEA